MNQKDWQLVKQQLERPFDPKKIHWRVGATAREKDKGIALAYIDARDVMKRLDDVMGYQWQTRYPISDGDLLICEIGFKLNNEWIWRGNGAGDTQVEAEKGKASDAFKRAAVLWGVGKYLYSLPTIWQPLTLKGNSYALDGIPNLPKWATPEGYDEIINRKKQ